MTEQVQDDVAAEVRRLKPLVRDEVGALTGFDELAIEARFRGDFNSLNPTMTMRALVFVQLRREGRDDKGAYGEAMRLTLKEVNERFEKPEKPVEDEDDDEGNG